MSARRRLCVLGVLLGVALLVAGIVVGALGLATSAGPSEVVRNYFAALARGDAQQALAYGDLPNGPHRLLTDVVLAEQLHIAPLRDVAVSSAVRDGDHADVRVRYELDFGARPVSTSVGVALHRSSGDWRLDGVAVPVEIVPSTAGQRLSVLGGPLPNGRTLVFPGALPVRVDTPYLEVAPASDYVSFGSPTTVQLAVQVSARGEGAVRAAIRANLKRCLAGPADPACPLPDERHVPGSVHGRLVSPLGGHVDLDQADPAGLLHYAGAPTIRGSWRRLDFHNVARQVSGQVLLDVRAIGYATEPLRLRWRAG